MVSYPINPGLEICLFLNTTIIGVTCDLFVVVSPGFLEYGSLIHMDIDF